VGQHPFSVYEAWRTSVVFHSAHVRVCTYRRSLGKVLMTQARISPASGQHSISPTFTYNFFKSSVIKHVGEPGPKTLGWQDITSFLGTAGWLHV
jgi:hypothetical protein